MKQGKMERFKISFHILLFVVLIAGVIYTYFTWFTSAKEKHNDALRLAWTAEASIQKGALKKLEGDASDYDKPQYKQIKNSLEETVRINPDVHSAYIYTKKYDRLILIAESEPNPTAYEISSGIKELEFYLQPLQTGEPFFINPKGNKERGFVSVLIPMRDFESQEVFAVFGMDYPVASWNMSIRKDTVWSGTFSALILLLFSSVYFILRQNIQLEQEYLKVKLAYAQLEGFFDVNLDMLFISDKDGNILKSNKLWNKVLGYSEEELKANKYSVFIHPDDMNTTLHAIVSLKSGHDVNGFTNRNRCKDGTFRHIEWNLKTDENFVYASARDITERVALQKKLIEDEQNFRGLFENIQDMIFIANPEGKILFANSAVIQKLGYSTEEVLAKEIVDLHPVDCREMAKNIFAQMVCGEIDFCPLPLLCKDEKHLPVETRIWFGTWDGQPCVYGFSKDLSLQQAALEKFHRIFNSNPAAMAVTSAETSKYTDVNHAFLEILGFERSEVIGNTPRDLNIMVEMDKFDQAISEIKDQGYLLGRQLRVRRKDGQILEGLFYGETIDNQFEKSRLTVMVDITERTKLEKRLHNSEEQYRLLISQMHQGLALHEMIYSEAGEPIDYRFIEVNKSFEDMTGLKRDEIIGKTVLSVLPGTEKSWIEKYSGVALSGIPLQFENYSASSNKYFEVFAYSPRYVQFACIVTDITERKRAEKHIEHLSLHDQLTGLYNRQYYVAEIKRLDTERNLPISLIMADVNGLKLTNDAFGHLKGDELLKKVADIFRKGFRAGEVISRIGGDEFVILLPKTNSKEAEEIINRIKLSLRDEVLDSIQISLSLGWATKNSTDENMEDVFVKAEDNMYRRKLFENPSLRSNMIKSIVSALHEKFPSEKEHSERVSKICVEICRSLKLSSDDTGELQTAGLLHDIGKISLSESILNKPGKLTQSEIDEIQRHPEIGYRILSSVNEMAHLANFTLAHHERWDGNGYPKGLKGTEIPLQARIIAVADAFDAITNDRPYRKASSIAVACAELKTNAGTQFDPHIVDAFIRQYEKTE